jgi:phage terminase large subunit
MLLRRLKYPMTTGLILRRTFPQLYKSHLVKLWEEFPKTRRWYNEQKKEMVFPNGSRLFFGSAEHAGDLDNFYSAEFADLMIDEAQSFSQNEIERLSGSVRCTSNPDILPKMLLTFMPGIEEDGTPPKGLPYLKRVFVEKDIRGAEKEHRWAFLQAFGWDNIEWGRKQLGWLKNEHGRWVMGPNAVSEEEFYSWPEQQRRAWFLTTDFGKQISSVTDKGLLAAWLDGKWDTFEGQYFAGWNYEKDTLPAQQFQMKKWHKRWISCDWGDDHPCVVHWHALDDKGNAITYREIWGRSIGETRLAEMIGAIEKQYQDQGFQVQPLEDRTA